MSDPWIKLPPPSAEIWSQITSLQKVRFTQNGRRRITEGNRLIRIIERGRRTSDPWQVRPPPGSDPWTRL